MILRRLAAAATLALVGSAAGGLGVAADVPPGPGPRLVSGAVVTPVLSARRVPELVARPAWRADLAARVGALAAELPPDSCVSVADEDAVVATHRPDVPLIPASNQKLLVAFAAHRHLDPGERLRTTFRTTAPVVDGVVRGDLWLVGAGDPLIASDDYLARFRRQPQLHTPVDALADALVAAGVRGVAGRLMADDSLFDDVRYIPSWPARYVNEGDAGPIGALAVNDGFVRGPDDVWRPAPDPAAAAAGTVVTLLSERGVPVEGGVGTGVVPAEAAEVAGVDSAPVGDLVAQMLRESDNNTAEALLKLLGARVAGEGSTGAGAAVIAATLAEAGVSTEGLVIVDGSGLDRGNRITCRLLLAVLTGLGPSSTVAAALPVAGVSGTLASRLVGTPAEGRVAAKTGSLRNVVALSGFVATAGDGTLTFASVFNGVPSFAAGAALQDRLVLELVAYPAVVPVDTVSPVPPP